MRKIKPKKTIVPNSVYFDTRTNSIVLVRKPKNFDFLICEVGGTEIIIAPWYRFQPQVIYIGKY